MGMTIHYDLKAPHVARFDHARQLVEQLHSFAQSLDFEVCTHVLTWDSRTDDPALGQFREYLLCYDKTPNAERYLSVPPLQLAMFAVRQAGSETALFGLASYEAVASDMADPHMTRATGLDGFQWRAFCKTQYASVAPEGGWENFLKIHDGICRILDHAAGLGIGISVHDDAGYWENRDAPTLHKEVDRWNSLIAAFTGKMKDAYGDQADSAIVAPITNAADFEHLEAKGQALLGGDFDIRRIDLPTPE